MGGRRFAITIRFMSRDPDMRGSITGSTVAASVLLLIGCNEPGKRPPAPADDISSLYEVTVASRIATYGSAGDAELVVTWHNASKGKIWREFWVEDDWTELDLVWSCLRFESVAAAPYTPWRFRFNERRARIRRSPGYPVDGGAERTATFPLTKFIDPSLIVEGKNAFPYTFTATYLFEDLHGKMQQRQKVFRGVVSFKIEPSVANAR
jgi:hypothetical protein